jgi:glycosyltransferase involved in cell wall biosynthesis
MEDSALALSLSVVICTHNPRVDYLGETLASLRKQEPLGNGRKWELILIDNASAPPLEGRVDLSWHPNARIVPEMQLGLTRARLRSFQEARGEILVYVDDDNVLDSNYLRETLNAFVDDPTLGAVGGRAIARYENDPPAWFEKLEISLACRDLGDAPLIAAWDSSSSSREYPICAPIGAGMGIRRSAYAAYVESVATNPLRMALGRRGTDLASGEDNDMVMTLLELGWRVAYLPQLRLEHLIPAGRLTKDYLTRYATSSNRTWVQVLGVHGLTPWRSVAPWTVPLRKARAFVRHRAWASAANQIRWRAACGTIEGQALLGAGR